MPPNLLQGMTTNARLTFSVGDTIRVVSNKYRARQIELVTLNTTFSDAIYSLHMQHIPWSCLGTHHKYQNLHLLQLLGFARGD